MITLGDEEIMVKLVKLFKNSRVVGCKIFKRDEVIMRVKKALVKLVGL